MRGMYCYYIGVFVSVLAAEMRAALVLLPLLLPESLVATLARGSGKRRAYYKPSSVESMSWFVDIQKVSGCHIVLDTHI